MSRMRSSLKPPLPKSPIRLRSRQIHRSNSSSLQTPTGSLTNSQKPTRLLNAVQEPELRPEFYSISCELRALAKMMKGETADELKTKTAAASSFSGSVTNSVTVFERGRFYEEYSARRNERLKRKKGEVVEDVKGTPYNLGVTHEPATTKRRGTAKKQQLECLKNSVSAAYTDTPRYMLRSMSKVNKKPSLQMNMERSVTVSAMKTVTTRKVRRI